MNIPFGERKAQMIEDLERKILL